MFKKEIISELINMEIDPSDKNLFNNIINTRKSRLNKNKFFMLSAIGLMLVVFGTTAFQKFWGELPDGVTEKELAAINAKKEELANTNIIAFNNTVKKTIKSETQNNSKTESKLETKAKISENLIKSNPIKIKKQHINLLKSFEPAKNNIDLKDFKNSLATAQEADYKGTNNLESPLVIKNKRLSNRSLYPQYKKINVAINNLALLPELKTSGPNKPLKYFLIPNEINVFTGVYDIYRKTTGNLRLSNKINQREDALYSIGYGFNVQYNLLKNGYIGLGLGNINYVTQRQDFIQSFVNHQIGYIIDPGSQPQRIDIYDTAFSTIKGGRGQHQFIDIPLTIGMRWQHGKHYFQPQMGLAANIYTKSKGAVLNENADALNGRIKLSQLKNVNLYGTFGLEYGFFIKPQYAIFINPVIRTSMTNIYKNDINQFQNIFGANFGIKYLMH